MGTSGYVMTAVKGRSPWWFYGGIAVTVRAPNGSCSIALPLGGGVATECGIVPIAQRNGSLSSPVAVTRSIMPATVDSRGGPQLLSP